MGDTHRSASNQNKLFSIASAQASTSLFCLDASPVTCVSHSLAGCQISAVATFIFPLQKESLLVVMKCTRYTKRVIRCMNNKILQSLLCSHCNQ